MTVEQPPPNKLAGLAGSSWPRTRSDTLMDLLSGNEILLVECLLYLHDKGGIDRTELAKRLESTAADVAPKFAASGRDARTLTMPLLRVAEALRNAIHTPDDEKFE